MIQIIDYGVGNLKNVASALRRLGERYEIITEAKVLKDSAKVVLPGVGAAGFARERLVERGFWAVLPALENPFLGICLGMQLLLDFSEEGETVGLGIIPGRVKRFKTNLAVPQIGWNQVEWRRENRFLSIRRGQLANQPPALLSDIPDRSYFYFVHSYFTEAAPEFVLAQTDYDGYFPSVIQRNNFYGVQFHPEKSGAIGEKLLFNFIKKC